MKTKSLLHFLIATTPEYGAWPPSDHSKFWSVGCATTSYSGDGESSKTQPQPAPALGFFQSVEKARSENHTPFIGLLSTVARVWGESGTSRLSLSWVFLAFKGSEKNGPLENKKRRGACGQLANANERSQTPATTSFMRGAAA